MNIFKIGLLFSVLLFNLSCAIIPDDDHMHTEENISASLDLDLNVSDKSFIELESLIDSKIENLLSYLDQQGIQDESAIKNLSQVPAEFIFTTDQLNEIEASIESNEATPPQKKMLHAVINHLRTENTY